MKIHTIYSFLLQPFRKRRMKQFERDFNVTNQTRILDVGGSTYNWQFLKSKPRVTILNLRIPVDAVDTEQFSFIEGDATKINFPNSSFDIAFSNSVIEHLFNLENQQLFVKEMQRIAGAHYIQTPAQEFFFEPHLLTPFIHWLPVNIQKKIVRNFSVWGVLTRPTQKSVESFLDERKLLTYNEFSQLLPEYKITKERFLFLTKSYIAKKQV